jgi:tetratricopeptide (TPR) repeat protein
VDEAKAYENEEQWFEALKIYDKDILSRKEYWSQQKASGERGQMLQDALHALEEYEDLSANVIKNTSTGRKYEKQGDWDSALRYYRRAVQFDFLPDMDLFEESQFRIDWINSIEKLRTAVSYQQE